MTRRIVKRREKRRAKRAEAHFWRWIRANKVTLENGHLKVNGMHVGFAWQLAHKLPHWISPKRERLRSSNWSMTFTP